MSDDKTDEELNRLRKLSMELSRTLAAVDARASAVRRHGLFRPCKAHAHLRRATLDLSAALADFSEGIMSDHWEQPGPLDGELESKVRASYDDRAPFYSIAVSLKRIADKLADGDQPDGDDRHPDDVAVDGFAADIKAALAKARRSIRYGWRDADIITIDDLAQRMAAQFRKRTPSTWVDIAAYAMMLHSRGADPSVLADAIRAAPLPAGPDSGDDSQPDGPVVDGRTVKVGDRVRLRSGDVLPVVEVMRYPDSYYPWQIKHYADRRPELYGSTGRQMHDGFDHHNDIVGFVDEPETPPAHVRVDPSGLRRGDVIRFQDCGFAIVGAVSGAMRNLTRVVYFTAYGNEIKEFRPDGVCDTDTDLRIVRVIRRGVDE